MMSDFHVTFWGVRGSIPVPGPSTVRYGGNTSCLDINNANGERIVFDAGTGLRVLGQSLDLSKKHNINLFISHPHWDHISGFPFFPVNFIPGNTVNVYGAGTFEFTLQEIFNGQMKYTYFPVRAEELRASLNFHELNEESITVGNYKIDSIRLNHPVTCLGYKVTFENKVFVYLGDNEPYYNVYKDDDPDVIEFARQMNNKLVDFIRNADTVVADAQYLPYEYPQKTGWGHSTSHHVVNMALKAGVKKLFFFHHEPLRSDDELDRVIDHYRDRIQSKGYSMKLHAAMEKKTFDI